jgi:hypothetical protein
MIFWTRGGDVVNLGEISKEECPTCEKERTFNLLITYRYFCLYWIFGFITKKQYMMCCDICDRGVELENAKIDAFLKEQAVDHPIPFMKRYGILVFVAGIILLLAFG